MAESYKRKGTNYGSKEFYDIGPWGLIEKNDVSGVSKLVQFKINLTLSPSIGSC